MKKTSLIPLLVLFCLIGQGLSAQDKKDENIQTWTETTEGDDEIGHYIARTTYEKGTVVASGAWKNWTTTIAIGAQFYGGDNDWKAKFSDMITGPAVDLYVNKWISPNFGLGLGFTYNPFLGLYQRQDEVAAYKTDEYYGDYDGKHLYRQKGHTFNPYVIALLDLDNLIAGYKPERLYNIAMYAGGGVIFGTDPIQARCGATFNMGFLNIFRVFKTVDLTINLRGSIVSDSFDGESRLSEPQTSEYISKNIPFDCTLGLTGGIVYHFGTKDKTKEWQKVGTVTKTYTGYADAKEEIRLLEEKLRESKKENEQLITRGPETIVVTEPAIWYHVQFKIDKWDVSNRERVNLKHVAEFINGTPQTKFSVCGYADIQTATADHNKMLSENRAKQVIKVLTDEFGVNPEQLVIDYKGGVDLMFYEENKLSRCVIIKNL